MRTGFRLQRTAKNLLGFWGLREQSIPQTASAAPKPAPLGGFFFMRDFYAATRLRLLVVIGTIFLLLFGGFFLLHQGSAQGNSSNISHASIASNASDVSNSPDLGSDLSLSLAQERQLGDGIAQQIWQAPQLLQDPLLEAYVASIFNALLQAARAKAVFGEELQEAFAWRFFLLRDSSVNAFALPGGYFGVHTGLLVATPTQHELASVLAHEISHVSQRHIARRLERQNAVTPWLITSILAALVLAARVPSQNSGDAIAGANAGIVSAQALALQDQLRFSRTMEQEADRLGYGLMEPSGFDPKGFEGMFTMLSLQARHVDNSSYPYLRSHPLTTERIAEAQVRRLNNLGTAKGMPNAAPNAVPNSAEWENRQADQSFLHEIVVARSRVLNGESAASWQYWVDLWAATERESRAEEIAATAAPTAAARSVATASFARQLRDLYSATLATHLIEKTGRPQNANARVLFARLQQLARRHPSGKEVPDRPNQFNQPERQFMRAIRLLGAELGDASALASLQGNSAFRPEVLLWAKHRLSLNDPLPAGDAATLPQLGISEKSARSGLADVSERLQDWVLVYPADKAAWDLLAATQEARGQRGRALISQARAALAVYDAAQARALLLAAQKFYAAAATSDVVDVAIVASLLRDLAEDRADNPPRK